MKGTYFITFNGDCEYVKISVTKNFNERLRHTSTHTPYNMDVLAFREVDDPSEEGHELKIALEKNYHQDFADSHHLGEWFHPLDEALEVIEYINNESGFTPYSYKRDSSSYSPIGSTQSPSSCLLPPSG